MSVEKFSVSFEPDLGRQIREMAEMQDVTVSTFLAEAARERVRQLLLERWLDEAGAELGLSRSELVERGRVLLADTAPPPTVPRRRRTKLVV